MTINRNDASPLHRQVTVDLRRRIVEEEFTAGEKLPSLRALTSTYDVSEVTVHTAIRELQREGLVTSTPGRGTFVSEDVAARLAAAEGTTVEALRQEVAELRHRVDALEARDD